MDNGHRTIISDSQASSSGPIQRGQLPHAEEHAFAPDLPRVPRSAAILILLAIAVLFAALFFIGWLPYQRRIAMAKSAAEVAAKSGMVVETVTPRLSDGGNQLTLPGDIRPNRSTAIFARATGYLKPPPPGIDIGAKVQEGQLIAEIAAPELDAQLDQARATLEQAKAAVKRAEDEHKLAVTTLGRYESAGSNAVSPQDIDEKRAQVRVVASTLEESKASVAAAEAAASRLAELQRFEKVLAPFAGVITARNFDAGAMITMDSGAGKELFRIAQLDLLRVHVDVPQTYSTGITVGQPVQVTVKNFPGRVFSGVIGRTAGSLDPATRSLRVEVDVPNTDSLLLAGMYAQVRLEGKRDHPALLVPTSALAFDAKGVRVAVVENGRVKYRAITQGRDFGAQVEVIEGLTANDVVINNPGTLPEGSAVTASRPAAKNATPAAAPVR
ncbi:MAG: efflux RND transporter periplasmic adaptor subunit [Planctomycetes bacterium]|nr:efflux RND transporter periplasmic adaptor subunit [Planctomycetota bacterium]